MGRYSSLQRVKLMASEEGTLDFGQFCSFFYPESNSEERKVTFPPKLSEGFQCLPVFSHVALSILLQKRRAVYFVHVFSKNLWNPALLVDSADHHWLKIFLPDVVDCFLILLKWANQENVKNFSEKHLSVKSAWLFFKYCNSWKKAAVSSKTFFSGLSFIKPSVRSSACSWRCSGQLITDLL